ncbi:4'-phosphopantetheinyl transferase [Frankia sp. CiP3]|uniref:4'-phosphopantetheinyl transferase family protein n=1 Tax=Frankia sp. CiP3 TaxID=2880971 RepID=UPI001EF5F882|nr:4'-phosphopantetheinyl transferase superfamily protein [Frankia sp. CiP3]
MPEIALLETLLPASAVAVEAFTDDPHAVLFAEEEATLAQSVDKRRREFTTARVCAHRALAGLGLPPAPILPGPRREPRWPAGVVGSITHCAGYRAAAVSRSADIVTIGIDAEPNEGVPPGVLDQVALAEERSWLDQRTSRHPEVCWDRLLFSAKESVYKAWFPLARRWLGFADALITAEPTGTFHARLLVAGPILAGHELTEFAGRWLVRNGLIITAIALPAGGPPPVTWPVP